MIKGLPEKLKMLRTKYNLSQKEVADKLCVSPSIISGYETGERTPSTENILALSHLYHCTTDYLLGNNIQTTSHILDPTGLSNKQTNSSTTGTYRNNEDMSPLRLMSSLFLCTLFLKQKCKRCQLC